MFLDLLGIVENTNKSMVDEDYLRHYVKFFGQYRDQTINVLEIGVSGGGSLRMWERYFSAATIVGIDVNEKCKQFEHGRVKVEIGSQADPAFLDQLIAKYPPTIVIDDGSHRADFTMQTFRHLFPALRPEGCYVIEDLYVHFGPNAPSWRGEATETPIDYLQRLVPHVIGSASRRVDPGALSPVLNDQIDHIGITPGAAWIWKKRASPATEPVLARLRAAAEESGQARNWFFLAGFLIKHAGPLEQADLAMQRALAMDPYDGGFYIRHAEVRELRGDIADAIAILQNGITRCRGNDRARVEAQLAAVETRRAARAKPRSD